MEEEVWRLAQQFRVLKELRANITGSWDDEQLRDMAGRYLNPHEEESDQLIQAFQAQREAIESAERSRMLAEERSVMARMHAMQVMEQFRLAREQMAPAFHEYEQSRNYEHMAETGSNESLRLSALANSACA
jgi:hypothetical protein